MTNFQGFETLEDAKKVHKGTRWFVNNLRFNKIRQKAENVQRLYVGCLAWWTQSRKVPLLRTMECEVINMEQIKLKGDTIVYVDFTF